jgi:hypothetical protein
LQLGGELVELVADMIPVLVDHAPRLLLEKEERDVNQEETKLCSGLTVFEEERTDNPEEEHDLTLVEGV